LELQGTVSRPVIEALRPRVNGRYALGALALLRAVMNGGGAKR
jgi:hypothetical protein